MCYNILRIECLFNPNNPNLLNVVYFKCCSFIFVYVWVCMCLSACVQIWNWFYEWTWNLYQNDLYIWLRLSLFWPRPTHILYNLLTMLSSVFYVCVYILIVFDCFNKATMKDERILQYIAFAHAHLFTLHLFEWAGSEDKLIQR